MTEDKEKNKVDSDKKKRERLEVIMSLAISHHNRANNLIGFCIIILTFFLGVTLQIGEVSNVLFQAVNAFIIVDIALLTRASFYYSLFETDFISSEDIQRSSIDLKRADTSMRVSLMLLQFEPALLALALGIYWVALLGFVLSVVFAATYAREQRRHKVLWPSHGLRYL